MQELRLVAVSEDGTYAVLVVPGRSGRFALPIDERLRTVARGQFSRLAQYEIEVESPLRPKEIQDRIRAGETAEEIADAAGLPVDRIRRFEGPVLAEREYQATQAQRATVRAPGESGPGQRLGDVVVQRLTDIGAGADDQEWDSRKRQDGNWQVQLAYTVAGRMHVAEWVYDPKSKHVMPADDEAIRLSLDQAHWPAAGPVAPAAPRATVTPIGSRLQHPSRTHGALPVHPSVASPSPVDEPSAAPAPPVPVQPVPVQPVPVQPVPVQPVPVQPAAASQEQPGTQHAGAEYAANDLPSQQARPAAAAETTREPVQETAPAPASEPREREPEQPPRPAKRASGGRPRRSSVPSWDEIMFGNSRQPE